MSESESPTLAEILHPKRAPKMSAMMISLLGYLFEKEWTDPQIVEVEAVKTSGDSESLVLARHKGEVGLNHTIGAASDLADNLGRWANLHDLTDDQMNRLYRRTVRRFGQEIADRAFPRLRA